MRHLDQNSLSGRLPDVFRLVLALWPHYSGCAAIRVRFTFIFKFTFGQGQSISRFVVGPAGTWTNGKSPSYSIPPNSQGKRLRQGVHGAKDILRLRQQLQRPLTHSGRFIVQISKSKPALGSNSDGRLVRSNSAMVNASIEPWKEVGG